MGWLLAWPAMATLNLQLMGEMTQGGLIRGQADPEVLLFLNGQQLQISPEGYFVFGFGFFELWCEDARVFVNECLKLRGELIINF